MKMHSFIIALAILFIASHADSTLAITVFPLRIEPTPLWQMQTAGSAKKPKKAEKSKSKKGGGVSFFEGSGESRVERDKRLSRECKGRANSGLCEGYTRP